MIDLLWQSIVTGVITAGGFALYLRLMKRADMRVMVQQTAMVGVLAAVISFGIRVLF